MAQFVRFRLLILKKLATQKKITVLKTGHYKDKAERRYFRRLAEMGRNVLRPYM